MQLRYQLVKYNVEAGRTHGDDAWQSLTFNTFHLVNNAVHCMLVAYLKTFEVQSCKRILEC